MVRNLVVATTLLAFVLSCGGQTESPDRQPGDQGRSFEVETFDGQVITSAELQGTPVVLNFWESW